jgi:hypothetical protein
MRITKERVHFISKTLLERLLEQNLITVQIPKEELVRRIEHVVTEELMIEDRLDLEVKEILKGYEAEMGEGNVDYRKMFLMVKKKLVQERGLIL